MRRSSFKCLILAASLVVAAPVFADADPTMHEVYEAAESGHLDQAQRMISQVLKDHPISGKAHYVAAEIYAREGNYSLARDELGQAQHLDPGLSFAKPGAVEELQQELNAHSVTGTTQYQRPVAPVVRPAAAGGSSFPFGIIIVGIGIIALIVFVTRRLRYAMGYRGVPPDGMRGGYGPGYGPGYGGYGAPPAGGIGSGIVGGLASGLAVGAGVVAGEELAHHFLDGDHDRGGGGFAPPVDNGGGNYNGDMGGNDFGVSDSSSWDSGSSGGDFGGGGGGSDWS